MDFSLSSSLVGSAVSNPDKLALDLQFATDKTLTARKGPTPVFTRASVATFIGSDGLIQSAATNTPRFDHDPLTLACKGLLIEESRTNLVFPSDTLTTQTRTVTAVAHTFSFYGTGTVVLSGAAIATVVGSGVYPTRTTLTFTPTAGSLILTVTGTIQFAQLEAGAFPTSYIPTTTASVVRSAEVCSISGSAFNGFYNQSEGTIVVQYDKSSNAVSKFNWMIAAFYNPASFSTYNVINGTQISDASTIYRESGTSIFNASTSSAAAGSSVKFAYTFKSGSFATSKAGVIAVTGSGVIPTTSSFDRVEFGFSNNGNFGGASAQYLDGHIASFQYYRKRLPNAKLQTLTV